MRVLSQAAGKVLDAVTHNLPVGGARTIDNTGGVYMPLHVDRLTERTFSLGHYYTQNGDRVCDPDGVFLKTDAGWLPVSLQLCTGHYTEAIHVAGDKPVSYRPKALLELISFTTMWMRNIASQQGGIVRIRTNISV
jgi:hypothetical protein